MVAYKHNKLVDLADDILDRFPTINDGGCGVFAALVAAELQHYYKIRIIAFSDEAKRNNIDEIRPIVDAKNIYDWKDNGCKFNHVVVEITDNNGRLWHYDATGVFPNDGSICYYYDKLEGSLTIAEITELADSPLGWSREFDRKLIPDLKAIIHKHFHGHPRPTMKALVKNVFGCGHTARGDSQFANQPV